MLSCAIATLVFGIVGIPFYLSLLKKINHNGAGLVLGLTALISFSFGIHALFQHESSLFYFNLSTLTLFIASVLKYYESIFLYNTYKHIHTLENLRPKNTLKKVRSTFIETETLTLQKDDIILVKAGGIIPVDGTIISGTTSVDETILTGEIKILLKEKGETVVGGTLNRDSEIQVQLSSDIKDNVLEKIIHTLNSNPPKSFLLYHKARQFASSWGFIGILIFLVTLYYMLVIEKADTSHTMKTSLSVLLSFSIFSFSPAALILANKLSDSLTKQGILIKKSSIIRSLVQLDKLFFDKTGTLTKGIFEYSQNYIEQGTNQGKLLSALFSLESQSHHFFSKAIETHPWYNEIPKCPVHDFKLQSGLGICGYVQPKNQSQYFAACGNLRFLKRMQMYITKDMKIKTDDLEAMGDTVVLCGYDRQVKGLLSFSDTLRPHVKETLYQIKKMKIVPAIITGDSAESLSNLIHQLKIENVFERCTPEEKTTKIAREKNKNNIIGMIGKNADHTAFEKADVSITLDTGTDISNRLADVLILGSDIRMISWLIRSVRSLYRSTYSYLFFSLFTSVTMATMAIGKIFSPEIISLLVFTCNMLVLRLAYTSKGKSSI